MLGSCADIIHYFEGFFNYDGYSILEDDPTQAEMLRWILESTGHKCHLFHKVKEFQNAMHRESFDLVLLDWILPDGNGPSIVEWIRQVLKNNVPILFITSKTSEENIVEALNSGADDYMLKPIRRGELIARTSALLRRAYSELTAPENFEIANFKFHPKYYAIVFKNKRVVMTQKEFEVALLFFRNLGKSLSRSHIQESVWAQDTHISSRTMDTHVSRVRSKLDLRPEAGFRLKPVYGYGYKLDKIENAQPINEQGKLRDYA